MYSDYWHLLESPFENILDFRFVYNYPSFNECIARLHYAVTSRTGAALIGAYGTGKSMTRESLVKEIKKEGGYQIFSIVHPKLDIEQIIYDCFFQMGNMEQAQNKSILLHKFGNKLVEFNEKGGHTVLIIDDAHLMDMNTLEELRLFCNLHDYNGRSLISILLIGESILQSKLLNIPSLYQRLRIIATVKPLDQDLTGKYIAHRLKVAQGEENIFLPDAVEEIYKFTGGSLREINNICDIALLIGANEKFPRINGDIITRIIGDIKANTGEVKS